MSRIEPENGLPSLCDGLGIRLAAHCEHYSAARLSRTMAEGGRSPRFLNAAGAGLLPQVRVLHEAGASLQDADVAGRTAFLLAAGEGHCSILDYLLSINRMQLGSRTVAGNTALHRACAYGHRDAAALLLSAGAAIDDRNVEGATPLSRASRWGHAEVVTLLLEHGARAALADNSGKTPLDWAREKQHDDVVAVLTAPPPLRATGGGASAAPGGSAGAEGTPAVLPPPVAGAAAAAVSAAKAPNAASPAPAAGGSPRAGGATSPSVPPPPASPPSGVPLRAAAHQERGAGGAPRGGAALGHLPVISESAREEEAEAAGRSVMGVGPDGLPSAYAVDDEEAAGDGASDVGGAGEDGNELGTPMHAEGWMAKQGQIFKTWKNRFFVLEGRRLLYYAREGAPKPKGVINMTEGTDVVIEERYAKPFCFTVSTPAKRYILQAADEEEMAEWIEAIQNNLECALPDGGEDGGGAGEDDD